MFNDPKQSVNYSNDITPKGSNNDITQIEEKDSRLNRDFNYLEIDNSPEKFIFEGEDKTNQFEKHKGKYDYIIGILLKDDSREGSLLLEKTLDGIYQNFTTLQTLGISSSNTLIFIFINKITTPYLFQNLIEIQNTRKNHNFYYYSSAHKANNQSSIIYFFTKAKELTDIEALKCYYLGIIDQIKIEKKPIFSSIITAGVEPVSESLKKLMLLSYNNSKYHGVTVSLIESSGYGLYSMIEQYERIHFNIYNMNFYGMSSGVPISSLLSTFFIDDNNFMILKNYYLYSKNNNQTIDFHDYNLGLYLAQNNINVQFYSNESLGKLHTNELEYYDYQEIWINRYSGYYGNIFELFRTFINCNNFNIIKKIMLFFQIIGFLIEFIYPSLSSMVIYSILYETFDIYDYRLATFFTMLYIFMLIASGMCSLVTKKPKEMKMANFFLYIFMEVYYLFIIICSIISMNNIKVNKSNNEYTFNNAAISCIIVFTFIPYILPMLLRIGQISSNFLNLIVYIGLGAPCSTSNFLMAEIWNASDTPGGYEIDERKSLVLIFFFLFNLFFGCLTFYNNTRRKRAESVMGFGIFYLLYNFFKITSILINILGNRYEAIDSNKNSHIINEIKNFLGKNDDYDVRSEEKSLKNSSQNFNNNYN